MNLGVLRVKVVFKATELDDIVEGGNKEEPAKGTEKGLPASEEEVQGGGVLVIQAGQDPRGNGKSGLEKVSVDSSQG